MPRARFEGLFTDLKTEISLSGVSIETLPLNDDYSGYDEDLNLKKSNDQLAQRITRNYCLAKGFLSLPEFFRWLCGYEGGGNEETVKEPSMCSLGLSAYFGGDEELTWVERRGKKGRFKDELNGWFVV